MPHKLAILSILSLLICQPLAYLGIALPAERRNLKHAPPNTVFADALMCKNTLSSEPSGLSMEFVGARGLSKDESPSKAFASILLAYLPAPLPYLSHLPYDANALKTKSLSRHMTFKIMMEDIGKDTSISSSKQFRKIKIRSPFRILTGFCRSIRNRCVAWVLRIIPINWVLQRLVRWLAFDASTGELDFIMKFCNGVLPIAQSAFHAAQLRDAYKLACEHGTCAPELRHEIVEVSEFLENTTKKTVESVLVTMDENNDGKVSIAEAIHMIQDFDQTSKIRVANATAAAPAVATMNALLEALSRAKATAAGLEKARYGIELAVAGSVAAIDADGDGKISLEEVVQAPSHVMEWLGLWRRIVEKDKL